MTQWQPIETAPKNESGESYGPWILAFHEYDHGIYQIRWECRGDMKGWFAKGKPDGVMSHRFTHWMERPGKPSIMQQ